MQLDLCYVVHISGTVSDTVTGFIYILTYQSIFKLFRDRRSNKCQRVMNSSESHPKITLTPSNECAPSKNQLNTEDYLNNNPVVSEMMNVQSSLEDVQSDNVKEQTEGQASDMRPNSVLEGDGRACELFTRYSPGRNIPYNAMQNKDGTLQQIGRQQQGDVFCLAYRDTVNDDESSRTTFTNRTDKTNAFPGLKERR